MALGKKQCKHCLFSFVRMNKFHSYLTHETLPAEEKVSRFDDHGKTPSCQTFADSSMRKVVPMGQSRAQGYFGSLSAGSSPNNGR